MPKTISTRQGRWQVTLYITPFLHHFSRKTKDVDMYDCVICHCPWLVPMVYSMLSSLYPTLFLMSLHMRAWGLVKFVLVSTVFFCGTVPQTCNFYSRNSWVSNSNRQRVHENYARNTSPSSVLAQWTTCLTILGVAKAPRVSKAEAVGWMCSCHDVTPIDMPHAFRAAPLPQPRARNGYKFYLTHSKSIAHAHHRIRTHR